MKKIIVVILFLHFALLSKSQNWTTLGLGTDASVFTLCTDTINNILYVGGSFQNAGGTLRYYVAGWDGANWTTLGSGMNFYVHALEMYKGNLYAGGNFTFAGGKPIGYLAKWDGVKWDSVSSSINEIVYRLKVCNGQLYGSYLNSSSLFKWDGNNLSFFGGLNNVVRALESHNNELYVGGLFTTAGGNTVNYVAKWDGTNWFPLGYGFNGYILSLKSFNDNLYAGGEFFFTGGTPAHSVARWDGTTWLPLGNGLNCSSYGYAWIFDLESFNNVLYATGTICEINGADINSYHIAQWDGSNWTKLGAGLNSSGNALAIYKNELYVGGQFSTAGGILVNNIARWGLTTETNDNIKESSFNIFPTPFANELNIITKNNELYEVIIYDITSRRLFQQKFTSTVTLNTEPFAEGIYLYEVSNKNGLIKSGKLVKE